ncbi:hypothetical protein GCM10022226_56220 [Sphaerisporangium flaviroseum]|uniref:VOC domain-containing protein n=1 Tax=Sphaerisporangium flaviroseum TaxID=509199 RepID=A0ABP7IVV0_9ACTN
MMNALTAIPIAVRATRALARSALPDSPVVPDGHSWPRRWTAARRHRTTPASQSDSPTSPSDSPASQSDSHASPSDSPATAPQRSAGDPPSPPRFTLTAVVLDTRDPAALARFYARLLGWELATEKPGWVTLRARDGSTGMSFQAEPLYEPPAWPARPGGRLMMAHLDIEVDDLEAARAHAVACGATTADFQPQDQVRVCLDPDGHPFCLWLDLGRASA